MFRILVVYLCIVVCTQAYAKQHTEQSIRTESTGLQSTRFTPNGRAHVTISGEHAVQTMQNILEIDTVRIARFPLYDMTQNMSHLPDTISAAHGIYDTTAEHMTLRKATFLTHTQHMTADVVVVDFTDDTLYATGHVRTIFTDNTSP